MRMRSTMAPTYALYRPPPMTAVSLAAWIKSELEPVDEHGGYATGRGRRRGRCGAVWVRQLNCWSTGRLKHSRLGFRLSVRASRAECVASCLASPGGTCCMEARYFSMRACSKPRVGEVLRSTNEDIPGRPRTAERSVKRSGHGLRGEEENCLLGFLGR